MASCLSKTSNIKLSSTKLAYAFIFTLPGVPFLYYGDEIGMRYLDVPTKEGGYFRTGSRTPMQWNDKKNHGFSGFHKVIFPQFIHIIHTINNPLNPFVYKASREISLFSFWIFCATLCVYYLVPQIAPEQSCM